jgi:hypothetical protein
VSKDSNQPEAAPRKFKLGPLGSLNQVTRGLAKIIAEGLAVRIRVRRHELPKNAGLVQYH